MLFDNYKKKSSLNQKVPRWRDGGGEFVRKGEIGDWVNHFDQETNRYQTYKTYKKLSFLSLVFWSTFDANNSETVHHYHFKFCVTRDILLGYTCNKFDVIVT